METLDIRPDLRQNPWTEDEVPGEVGKITKVGFLPEATDAGHPAVYLVIEMENGEKVVGATTMRLFTMAARGGLARYGEPE